MGITGELVRSVFSKSRSTRTHESNIRSNSGRRKWKSSVRSYLCGDEFNSVLAEEDSASIRSSKVTEYTQPEVSSVFADGDYSSVQTSEATVTQPVQPDLVDNGDAESKGNKEEIQPEKHNSTSKLFRKDDAATVIQTAVRSFLARRCKEQCNLMDGKEHLGEEIGSPGKESLGTSIEVQTGNSEVLSLREESVILPQRVQQKSRSQVMKLKEDWDDSTVSSNISKLRIQNRLEATTRRERALAYAFSQQLRICSRKKHTRSESDCLESSMGWSWLERWMATRQQETCLTDITKQYEPINPSNHKSVARKRLLFDVAGEERESCGSNEVSIQFDNISITTLSKEKDEYRTPLQNKLKVTGISRSKTMSSNYHYPKEKVIIGDCAEADEKCKPKQPAGNRIEVKSEDATCQVSPEIAIPISSLDNDLSREN